MGKPNEAKQSYGPSLIRSGTGRLPVPQTTQISKCMERMRSISLLLSLILLGLSSAVAQDASPQGAKDIRRLSQNFIDPKGDISPWIFYPTDNINAVGTTNSPGILQVEDAGKGKDIRGVLRSPIKISDYPLPWEFDLGFLQPPFNPGPGTTQTNYAFGVNLAVTFSDPSTWPSDRTQLPPDTHSLQLFVVHIGNYGELYRDGVPQLKYSELTYGDSAPEAFLLYGRGDLAPNVVGNWKIPDVWLGYDPPKHGQLGAAFAWSWRKVAGPAENGELQDVRFRVRTLSPTQLEVGFGFGFYRGWRMRTIDVSHFGKITGIWEIGPIISQDRWMAETMAPSLGVHPTPELDPPLPGTTYYIDYANFFGNGPENFDHLSVDFDTPGVPADQKWFLEGDGFPETYSHPGYLTVTFSGRMSNWAMCPILDAEMTAGLGYIELSKFKPPLEFEIGFIAEDDSIPWNLWHSFYVMDDKGKSHSWSPGIQNIPGKGRAYIDQNPSDAWSVERNPEINLDFGKAIPQSLLTHKPLRMLIQIVDTTHLRIGLRANQSDPWLLSKPFDTSKVFGSMSKFSLPCPVSSPGTKNAHVGNYPHHLQLLIDYVHYRYGLSTAK